MRLILLAVGRTKAGPETELAARYQDRAAKAGKALGFRGVEAITLDESRAADVAARKAEEATAIRRAGEWVEARSRRRCRRRRCRGHLDYLLRGWWWWWWRWFRHRQRSRQRDRRRHVH